LLIDDDQKEKEYKNSQVSKHLEEKEKEIKSLRKQIEDMELNSRSTEDKFKNQLKIYDELADKLKEKEALEERCDLLSNTIKLKDDIIWKLKNLNPEMTKEIDDLIANYKDKSTSLRKVKDVADDIEGSLRLEIEKLTLNLNH